MLKNKTNILTAKSLRSSLLSNLFCNEIAAIRIPNYCDDTLCHKLTKYFIEQSKLECYYHEIKNGKKIEYLDYGVDRLGTSFNTTYIGNSQRKEKYYRDAVQTIKTIRNILPQNLSPFDKFRLELDEFWPGQVGIANFEGMKMLAGIVRVMSRPQDTALIASQPHVDFLPEKFAHLEGQFAVNIYISLPETGGELELWDVPPVTAAEHQQVSHKMDWRSQLPSPHILKPQLGELVMFNSRRPHAVRGFTGGPRISIQSFIGLLKADRLVLWS